jgi:hypothetical protein
VAGPGGVYVQPKQLSLEVVALDGRDGSIRWRKALLGELSSAVDTGLVVHTSSLTQRAITIIDPDGNTIVTRSISGTSLGSIQAVPSRDGTIVAMLGTFTGTLDLGDMTLKSATETNFFALLDLAGTTRWAYTLDLPDSCGWDATEPCENLHIGFVGTNDEIVMDGVGLGVHDLLAPYPTGFVAVLSPAGLKRVVPVSGPANSRPWAIAPMPDGSAWFHFAIPRFPDFGVSEVTVGSTTYSNTTPEGEVYLLNLIP